jgi:hypothetical protein
MSDYMIAGLTDETPAPPIPSALLIPGISVFLTIAAVAHCLLQTFVLTGSGDLLPPGSLCGPNIHAIHAAAFRSWTVPPCLPLALISTMLLAAKGLWR